MHVLRAFVDGTLLLTALHPEHCVLVGCGADCDLRLETAGMPERAAAIRDVRGVLRLIPLSDVALRVNGQPVTSPAGVALHHGAHVTLAGVTVAVRLVIDADALKAQRARVRLEIAPPPRTTVTVAATTAPCQEAGATLPEIELDDDDLIVLEDHDAAEDSGVHSIYDAAEEAATERVAG